jgi:hypothetical protein
MSKDKMKLSTLVIWLVELEILAYYQIMALIEKEAMIYLFVYTLVLVLAIFANKTFKLTTGVTTLEVEKDENKNG